MVPLLLALPVGPMLAWKRGDLLGVAAAALRSRPLLASSRLAGASSLSSIAGRGWRRSALPLGAG